MRLSFKVLASLWIGLLIIIGGLLINAYSKLKPETFIALLTEQVQKNYPGAKLQVGKMDYRFSMDFNLNLQNIHLRRSGKLLASIAKVELKVPWWILIVNRGNAQINLSGLDIYVDHHKNHEIKAKKSDPSKAVLQVAIPNYLADARYTLRAKDVSIRDIHNERRYFTLSKLLVREFQYGKNSAFELNIPIEITHKGTHYTSDLWLFGDVTPNPRQWKLHYRGEFRTRENNDRFQIEDIVIDGNAIFQPLTLDVVSRVELEIEKNKIGKGTLEANQDKLSVNFDLTQLPVSYFSFVQDEMKNPYLPALEGVAQGSLKFEKFFNTDLASAIGKLSFNGDFQVSRKVAVSGTWQLNFQNSRWEISFIDPKGEASFFRRSVIDMNRGTVTQYNEEIGFSGLELSEVATSISPFGEFAGRDHKSFFHTNVSFKNCVRGDKTFNGMFRYGATPDQKFYQGNLSDAVSEFKLNYLDMNSKKQFEVNFSNFSWEEEFTFLVPHFKAKSGTLNGKVEGRWSDRWDQGTWLGKITAINLKNTEGSVPDLIQNTLAFFDMDENALERQSLQFSAEKNTIHLRSLLFDVQRSWRISGQLSDHSKKKSFLVLEDTKNKKIKKIRKEVSTHYWKTKDAK